MKGSIEEKISKLEEIGKDLLAYSFPLPENPCCFSIDYDEMSLEEIQRSRRKFRKWDFVYISHRSGKWYSLFDLLREMGFSFNYERDVLETEKYILTSASCYGIEKAEVDEKDRIYRSQGSGVGVRTDLTVWEKRQRNRLIDIEVGSLSSFQKIRESLENARCFWWVSPIIRCQDGINPFWQDLYSVHCFAYEKPQFLSTLLSKAGVQLEKSEIVEKIKENNK